MRFNLFYFLFFVIFIYSCSGGGSSQLDDTTNNNNQSNQFNERCLKIGTNTQRCTFLHNNLERFYLIYSPQSLNQSIDAPILFALHGYGSSASFHKSYTYAFWKPWVLSCPVQNSLLSKMARILQA